MCGRRSSTPKQRSVRVPGLLLGTLSLAALASAFKGFNSAEFNLILVLCVAIVGAYVYMHYTFAVPSKYISLEDACSVDRSCDAARVSSMLSEDRGDALALRSRARLLGGSSSWEPNAHLDRGGSPGRCPLPGAVGSVGRLG